MIRLVPKQQSDLVGQTDARLVGYLLCIWSLAFTALFGFEIQRLVVTGNPAYAFYLASTFVILIFVYAYLGIRSRLLRVRLTDGSNSETVLTVPAPKEVVEDIRARVRALGLRNHVDVLLVPKTWGHVDGWVAGIGQNQSIVITGGLLSLFYAKSHDSHARYQFIVDHEIGHIAHGDTSILYLAFGTLNAILILLPIKLFLSFQLLLGNEVAYAELLPRSFLGADLNYALWIDPLNALVISARLPTKQEVWIVMASITAITLTLCLFVHVLLVRRREFMADRFALLNAPDPTAAQRVFSSLVNGPGLKSAPAQSFIGNLRWHPRPVERLQALGKSVAASLDEGWIALLLTMLLLLFRISFSPDSSRGLTEQSTNEALIAGFVLCFGAATAALASPGAGKIGAKINRINIFSLTAWSIAISAIFALGLVFVQPIPNPVGTSPDLYNILRLERMDWILLICSIPFVISIFIGCQKVVFWIWKGALHTWQNRFTSGLIGTSVAVTLIYFIGSNISVYLEAHRTDRATAFAQAIEKTLLQNAFEDAQLDPVEDAEIREIFETYSETSSACQPNDPSIECLQSSCFEKHVATVVAEHRFEPPFSLIWLEQVPLRQRLEVLLVADC